MLNTISWQGYWIAIALSATAYYAFLYLRFFRGSIRLPANNQRNQKGDSSLFSLPSEAPTDNILPDRPATWRGPAVGDGEEEVDEPVFHACLDELTAFFEAAGSAKLSSPELLAALQVILTKYPALSRSAYKETVTSLLVAQCKHYCALELSEGDLWRVWSGS